jgi:hypothetical protein
MELYVLHDDLFATGNLRFTGVTKGYISASGRVRESMPHIRIFRKHALP